MSGGSWNNGGRTPGHMGAWCKLLMGWATPITIKKGGVYDIPQVETNKKKSIFKLWTNGKAGKEYFVVENRQQVGFDSYLPHNGMLVWHVDEGQKNNDDQAHYLVALEQADGENSLENGVNFGDTGDPFPGSKNNRSYDDSTKPSSMSYSGDGTKVSIGSISDPGKVMKAMLKVK
jgi:immune inhibitor A